MPRINCIVAPMAFVCRSCRRTFPMREAFLDEDDFLVCREDYLNNPPESDVLGAVHDFSAYMEDFDRRQT